MKLLRQIRGAAVFFALMVNTFVWFVPIFLLAIVKLAVPVSSIRRYLTGVLMWLTENWVGVNSWIFHNVCSVNWDSRGIDSLNRDSWYLVIANHQSWVDIVLLQHIFNRRIPLLKFFIKQELVWIPMLGVAWWALDMPFMKRHSPSYLAKHPEQKGKDLAATKRACKKFQHRPTSVISFVEGTRYNDHKRDARGTAYRHVLAPRAGGIAITLASMGSLFDQLLDVTICYPKGPANFWHMCCGLPITAFVDVDAQTIPAAMLDGDYENDREFRRDLHRWLTELWQKKDAKMDVLLAAARD